MMDGPLFKTAGAEQPLVAYFSMEIGIDPGMPTYAGGLGVLAGDTIRSAADLEIPMVAVTLLHRRGYFYQRLDEQGWQREEPVAWPINDFCYPIPQRVTVEIEGRTVQVGAWHIRVRGETGGDVLVYLLDTDLPENDPWDRTLTDMLYGGDDRYRLCQEVVLGFGGYRLLRALGYNHIRRFHLNEGHAALLVLALLEEKLASRSTEERVPADLIDAVREQCVFTTHTPVPAGHDQFPHDLARRVLGERRCLWLDACLQDQNLNMTRLALRGSRFINGVAMKHGE
ncbi:MAG: alpha-glucan family phosphorylase, partial [Nitrospira sp.]|nr:alpha-glucan family phosphorylase [Nitrospira sp.]